MLAGYILIYNRSAEKNFTALLSVIHFQLYCAY